MQDSDTTKYIIYASITADGVVERPDVVGAIFGQTEGLLGPDLDLRDLQKTGRIGRIEVNIESKGGKSTGTILIPSSLDKTETSVLAASLETIDRVGPCVAKITVSKIEDIRATKRKQIIERAKHIVKEMFEEGVPESHEILEEVRQAVRVEEITYYNNLPAGPNIEDSDAILVVEGRADVLNLLRHGIKNAIAVEGTNVPSIIGELSKTKTVTVFTDGDRGGELILKELLQIADIDYIATAPEGKGVEELSYKEIVKALRNKLPVEQVATFREGKVHKVVRRRTLQLKREEDVFKKHLKQLSGTLGARLLDKDKRIIKEVAVRELADVLKNADGDVKSIVFDGVITQRILDVAAEKNLEYVVGVKLGNVVKAPVSVKVLTTEDL
ncbi:MAG: DNA primase DnaG [Candidatus Syntropharchaeia archaeon]